MNQTEIKYIDHSGTVKMKAVPIIGEAVQDGTVESRYFAKLEELERSGATERLSDDQVAEIPSRIIR